MKTIFAVALFVAFWSPRVFAVDTSGCSQTDSKSASMGTSQGKQLSVSTEKATRSTCWNANAGQLTLRLQWPQNAADATPEVSFWVRVNGSEQTLKARVQCEFVNQGTSGKSSSLCRAYSTLSVPGMDTWKIEVAPVVNGIWDTFGYGQNYSFQL